MVVDESTATGESKTMMKSIDSDPFLLSGTRITDVKDDDIFTSLTSSFRVRVWLELWLLERIHSMAN